MGDVERLADCWFHDREFAEAFLTSDWLAAHDAEVAADARREALREAAEHTRTGWQVHDEHVERTNREHLHQQAVIDELKRLLHRACADNAEEDCWFDHNGGCQAHGFLSEPCPYPLIRQYLAPTEAASHTPEGGR